MGRQINAIWSEKKELVLWESCVGLILLYLLSSTDWIIKEKEVEVYPVSLIISDTSDDDYVNFARAWIRRRLSIM